MKSTSCDGSFADDTLATFLRNLFCEIATKIVVVLRYCSLFRYHIHSSSCAKGGSIEGERIILCAYSFKFRERMQRRAATEDTTSNFHMMFSLDLNSSSTSSSAASFANDYSSRGPSPPPAPRRRSHRPRGCRGGRKNRKNKPSTTTGAPSQEGTPSASTSSSSSPSTGILPDAPFSQRQNQTFPQLSQGNLSAYQHVRTTTPSESNHPHQSSSWLSSAKTPFVGESTRSITSTIHTIHHNISPTKKKPSLQVLPPALPPFLAGKDPFLQGGKADTSGDLKMLPSFDDSVTTVEGIPSPIKHQQYQQQQYPPIQSMDISMSSISSSQTKSSSTFALPPMDHLLGRHHHHLVFDDDDDGMLLHDNSLVSLSSDSSACSSSEEQQQHVAESVVELLFSTAGSSLFETSPRSFLTGGEKQQQQQQPVAW